MGDVDPVHIYWYGSRFEGLNKSVLERDLVQASQTYVNHDNGWYTNGVPYIAV